MPSVDDELNEIRSIIEGDIAKPAPSSDSPDSAEMEPGKSASPVTQPASDGDPKGKDSQMPRRGLSPRFDVGDDVVGPRQKPESRESQPSPDMTTIRKSPVASELNKSLITTPISRRRQPPAQTGAGSGMRYGADREREKDSSDDVPLDDREEDSPDTEDALDIGPERFSVNFDFERAYKDVPEDMPLRIRREKRTGCVGGILYGAFVIAISIILATIMWMAAVDVLGFGVEDEQVNVTVHDGFTIEDITDMLYDADLIRYKPLFNLYAGFSKAEEKISAGAYVLNKSFDYRALVQGMTARAGIRVETTVTLPEGLTMAQMFTILEDYGVCTSNDLWETATNYEFNYDFLDKQTVGERLRLEGFLFPDTYGFYLDSSPVQVLNKLLREFDRRFNEDYIKRAEDMGYTIHEIITIASMIEREAGSEEERPRIASVIYNRLNSRDFPLLQIDATIHYAISGTGRPFSTSIDHPYNTYKYEGLPPGPIASPSMGSIRAALYPASTDAYYYALSREGTHRFFKTLAQQEAFVHSDEYGG